MYAGYIDRIAAAILISRAGGDLYMQAAVEGSTKEALAEAAELLDQDKIVP